MMGGGGGGPTPKSPEVHKICPDVKFTGGGRGTLVGGWRGGGGI